MRGWVWRSYLGAGIRWHRPPRRAAWWLIAAAQGLLVAGDALFSVNELILGIEPFPSLADALCLPGYPVLVMVRLAGLARGIEHCEAELALRGLGGVLGARWQHPVGEVALHPVQVLQAALDDPVDLEVGGELRVDGHERRVDLVVAVVVDHPGGELAVAGRDLSRGGAAGLAVVLVGHAQPPPSS
jgi:hypothetical protein